MGELFDKFKEKMESPEGQEAIKKLQEKWKAESDLVIANHANFEKLSQNEFDVLIMSEIHNHDDAWIDECYANGVMPYEKETLNGIYNVARDFGETVEDTLSSFDENFPSEKQLYRGYYFVLTHGQGSVLSIFDKNKELIHRL